MVNTSPKMLVCIPAFNEEKQIGQIVKRAKHHCSQVIVCDDGSIDETAKEAKAAGAMVLCHNINKGKGRALKTLFNHAKILKPDIVITIDGDGQFLPEEIDKIIQPILDGKADIVTGFRFENAIEMPTYRKIGNIILDKITNMASELPIRDSQSGFRAYSKKALELIQFNTDGFGADSEILINASTKGLRILEKDVTVLYNTNFKTSTKNPISHTSEVLVSIIELIAIRRPLTFLGIPGIILTILGLIFAVTVVTIFNDTRYFSIPTTLAAVGTFLGGLLLTLMSVVLYAITKAKRSFFNLNHSSPFDLIDTLEPPTKL